MHNRLGVVDVSFLVQAQGFAFPVLIVGARQKGVGLPRLSDNCSSSPRLNNCTARDVTWQQEFASRRPHYPTLVWYDWVNTNGVTVFCCVFLIGGTFRYPRQIYAPPFLVCCFKQGIFDLLRASRRTRIVRGRPCSHLTPSPLLL